MSVFHFYDVKTGFSEGHQDERGSWNRSKNLPGHELRKDRFSVGESRSGPLLHLRERPFSGKNDIVVLKNAHFNPCSAGIGIILPRKKMKYKGVFIVFSSKTATGGSKVKETPVFAIGVTSERTILRRRI
jgi:hypothetical protein